MFGAIWHNKNKKKPRRGEDGTGEAPAESIYLLDFVSSELDEVCVQTRREVRGGCANQP